MKYRALCVVLLLMLAVPTLAQRLMEVRNPRGERLNTSAEQSGPWSVDISTTASISATTSITASDMSITVSGGTGFSVFSATGTLSHCMVSAPASSRYDLGITTEDGFSFPVAGRINLVEDINLFIRRAIIGSHRVTVSNAAPDGSYAVRCIILE